MASLFVDIITNTAKAVADINKVGSTAEKQKSSFNKMGSAIAGAVSVTAVVAFGKAAVTAAADDQKAQELLATALKNTTGATDTQVAAAEDYITALSKQTAIADDELRPALATLTRATGDQMQAQRDLALATDIAAGTGKPLATVVKAMASAAKGSTGAFAKLTGQSKDLGGEAKTMDQLLGDAAKTFSGQAAVAAETTAGKMEGAKIAMDEMSETVGTALLPALGGMADFLAENISWLGPLALAIGAVVLALQAWILLTNAGIIPAIAKWIIAQGGLNAVLLANPIVLIVAAVVALIAIGILLWKNWDKVVAFLKKAWATIKRVALAVWDAIGDTIEKVWENIKKAVAAAIDWVKDKISTVFKAISTVVKAIWNGIKDFFKAYWEILKTIFGTPIAWIKDKVGDVFRGIKDTIKTVWDAISTYFTTLWTDITAIFQTAWDYFEDFVDFLEGIGDILADTWDTVTDTITLVWESVVEGVKSAINVLIDGINFLIRGINKAIDFVNKLPVVNLGHIKEIPRLAQGGVLTRATMFVGGEAGTEIVTPEKLLRSILREEGGGRGGGNYTLNMYPRRADAADVAWGFRRLELARTGR